MKSDIPSEKTTFSPSLSSSENSSSDKEVTKAKFRKFSKEKSRILKEMFKKNIYPTNEEIEHISKTVDETVFKVRNWFKYYRKKTNCITPSYKKRTLTKDEIKSLEKAFEINQFPSIMKLKELGKIFDLKPKKLADWFSYKRRKQKQVKKPRKGGLNIHVKDELIEASSSSSPQEIHSPENISTTIKNEPISHFETKQDANFQQNQLYPMQNQQNQTTQQTHYISANSSLYTNNNNMNSQFSYLPNQNNNIYYTKNTNAISPLQYFNNNINFQNTINALNISNFHENNNTLNYMNQQRNMYSMNQINTYLPSMINLQRNINNLNNFNNFNNNFNYCNKNVNNFPNDGNNERFGNFDINNHINGVCIKQEYNRTQETTFSHPNKH